MTLPTDYAARKALPIWDGVIMYFPDVWAEIAKVSVAGNKQHNGDEKLHWAREKSTDQMNTAFRHMHDRGVGNHLDSDGTRHLAKAIWRLCAQLQLDLEADIASVQAEPAPRLYPDNFRLTCSCEWCEGVRAGRGEATIRQAGQKLYYEAHHRDDR